MASKRKLGDAEPAPEAAPESPTAYRDLTSALINALDGFLVPLVALREKAQAAGDAEVYVAQAQERLATVEGQINARLADLAEITSQAELAARNTQERVALERQRVAEARERANADIERVRAERATELERIDAIHRDAAAKASAALAALNEQIEERRAELTRVERAVVAGNAALDAIRVTVGARS